MHDDLDRILAGEDKIVPSPRFVESVMEAVEQEAAARRPLEFPWFRALPGFLATIVALAAAVWNGIRLLSDPVEIAAFDKLFLQLTASATSIGLHWILLAAAITIVSMTLPLSLFNVRKSALL